MLIKERRSVIIAGAGPVGLLIAICLGREGVSTLVLEKNDTLPRTLRAIVNNPVVLRVLSKCGFLDAVMKEAYVTNEGITWQDSEGNRLAQLNVPNEDPDQYGGVMLIGQARMNDILLKEVKKYPSVKVIFSASYTGV